MSSINKVTLIGRVGTDPEKKITNTGRSVANLNIATNENFTDNSGVKQERTTWHRVTLWANLADLAEKYVKKGSLIYVEGRLQNREYNDAQGQKRYATDIVVNEMKFLDSGSRSQGQGQNQGQGQGQEQGQFAPSQQFSQPQAQQAPQQMNPSQNQNAPKSFDDDFMEDDIPF